MCTDLQLLRMGRINAVVMPVFATVICILLFAYHLKDPTQDGQVQQFNWFLALDRHGVFDLRAECAVWLRRSLHLTAFLCPVYICLWLCALREFLFMFVCCSC